MYTLTPAVVAGPVKAFADEVADVLELGQGHDAVVFLHGLFASPQHWHPIMRDLADRYRVVAPQLPVDHQPGRRRNGIQTIEDLTGLLVRLIETLNLRRFVLCGNSLGGLVAMDYCLRHPGRGGSGPFGMDVLAKSGVEFLVEAGAGAAAGMPDKDYANKGARMVSTRAELFREAEVVLQVRTFGANPEAGAADLPLLRSGQVVIGYAEPLTAGQECAELARTGASLFSMELMPRITRAQSMDSLSSMATIAGYKAVLMAADALPRMFPMLMTAAGTIAPAKVFVLGAGVAGLQAIATARRLGAVVSAYDVRPAVKEQVESLGAKFVQVELETAQAEDKGGYAKELGEEFYRKQREVLLQVIREQDVVITTAAVPGKKAPILITKEMLAAMAPGSVVVDLAAERGGNCEGTQAGKTISLGGVTIMGPLNLPSEIPYHASQMYARNIATFLKHLIKDGKLTIDTADEITRETLVAHAGQVVNPRVRQALGLPVETPGSTGA